MFHAGVKGIAEAVAHDAEADHDQDDGDRGVDQQERRGAQGFVAVVDQNAQRRFRLGQTDADEAQEGFREDRGRDRGSYA